MFRRLSEPLPLSEASLLLFRPALNAPVLNVGYLPIGPARAAVVAFGEEYGGIGIALGVRASESGQLAVLRNRESIDFDVPLAEALEPLLEEAERMGFLFDEDMLEESPGQAGRAQAMAYWADLMGGMESFVPYRSPTPESRRRSEEDESVGPLSPSRAVEEMQYPELMLDEVAPLELDDDLEEPLGLDATETLEPDLEPAIEPERADASRVDGPDLVEPLEEGLDEALAAALGETDDEDLLDDTPDDDDDWCLDGPDLEGADLDAPLLGESDLTEPTAPIALARAESARPVPAPMPVVEARTALASSPPDGPTPKRPPEPPAPPALAAAPRRASAPTAPAPLPRVVLSKFRHPDGLRGGGRPGRTSEVGADRSSELARIPIVRVRRQRDPGKRVPFLARLLSSF